MTRASIAIFACLAAAPASANVWQQAIERKEPDLARVLYEDTMGQGDDALEQATSSDATPEVVRAKVEQALEEYRNAAAARPDTAEPWFRIASVLYSFYVRDSGLPPRQQINRALSPIATWSKFDREHGRAAVDAWEHAEKLAPLDPRFTVTPIFGTVLSERALMETRLIDGAGSDETKRWLQGAARDYEKILSRSEVGFTETEDYERTLGNLAETYMMLDDLERAIDTYRAGFRRGSQVSTVYGLAVALDRADEPVEAMALIVQQGEAQYIEFRDEFNTGQVFFVPVGEVHYYLALIAEAFGHDDEAIPEWQAFIKSNAHPEFQHRARQHLDALLAHHVPVRQPKPMDFDDDR
jgi:tetratricopeptide (TPR) repeat protein